MASISFYTTGKEMTATIMDFVRSGQFYNALSILKDGGIDDDTIKGFLLNKFHLVGDSRTEEGLQVEPLLNSDDTDLLDGWCTLAESHEYKDGERTREASFEVYNFETVKYYIKKGSKELNALFEVFTIDEFIELFKEQILIIEGYAQIKLEDQTPINSIRDGVILEDGSFIEVDFEGHRYLYPILEQLKLSNNDGDEWGHRERKCIRISDMRVCGKVVNKMAERWNKESYKDIVITDEQITALHKWSEHFPRLYNKRDGNVMNAVRKYLIETLGQGAKYGNLTFLKRFTSISTPKVGLLPLEGTYALRTSPTKSIAGLLESKFNVTKETHQNNIDEMNFVWSKYGDIIGENELHIFSQEILEGKNGVCHYKQKGDYSYSVSSKRGDVVNGIKDASTSLNHLEYDYLRKTSRELNVMLGEQIQLEFVCNADGVHVVQLRTINTPLVEEEIDLTQGDIVAYGRSFSIGEGVFNLEDTLVVDSQCDSKELLNKKCLIVREMVDFSHVLTLSESLNIPSIYGIGDAEIPERFRINTKNTSGIIMTFEKK